MSDARPDRKLTPEEAEANMILLAEYLSEQDKRLFEEALTKVASPVLKERYLAVLYLATECETPRWYEAWQVIEQRINDEPDGTLRGNMACALSMITARNNPHGMLYGQEIPNHLVPYRETVS